LKFFLSRVSIRYDKTYEIKHLGYSVLKSLRIINLIYGTEPDTEKNTAGPRCIPACNELYRLWCW